ncbi:MAG: cyclic peptide export ABC transporter [Chitinophagaceae bacterium]|nr:cyclic peptide export ABC transporter [Chitinophagaceae bacterium]
MKKLIRFIFPLIGLKWVIICLLLGIFSGLLRFLFVALVSKVINNIQAGSYISVDYLYVYIFLAIILSIILCRRRLSLIIIDRSQTLFWKLRLKVISILLKADNEQLSSRKERIYSVVLHDIYVLTDTSFNLIEFFSALVLAISCFAYLSFISLHLFIITVIVAVFGVALYYLTTQKNQRDFEKVRMLQNRFQSTFSSLLDGFKELYMEPQKGDFLFHHRITKIADDSYKTNIKAYTGFLNNQIIGQILFYILITSTLLVFSIVFNIPKNDLINFVFALIYLLGSLETIMIMIPNFMKAKVSANHLMSLCNELTTANFKNAASIQKIAKSEFEIISISGLLFSYKGVADSFEIGPVDFCIKKGEVIFIGGSNGSGKTTLVNSILGICTPSSGEIKLNNKLVNGDYYSYYRTAFSVIFSDFYLFDEILSNGIFDYEKWEYYLGLFELTGKVNINDGVFSTTKLSAGQRKRLALVVALLEEKPVLVIDEWAADQDPFFRKKFYTEIIPILKIDGFSIIAITHDDMYYHCADKLFRMEEGRLVDRSLESFIERQHTEN